ncbi:hypothetical protein HK099_006699 [Clydaea vesicula]|uniref:Uncharacterized protein n=1 Tax=Clydaea vesicula TaxID=447962 RepID=A0AAD5XU62_9FUNG|nr:hypothetical protein HK099_006699 [Clydaea vesicula]
MSFQICRALIKVQQLDKMYMRDPFTQKSIKIPMHYQWFIIAQQEGVLPAFCVFTGLAGFVVLVFFLYQLSMVYTGKTANETFKWSDIKYAIKTGALSTWSAELKKYNQSFNAKKKPMDGGEVKKNRKKMKRKDDVENDDIPLKSIKEIKNIYDNGFFQNLKDWLLPAKL